MPMSPRTRTRLFLAVLLVGALYRCWRFWDSSLWIDEFVTEWILQGATLADVTERARYAYMPPLFFWLSVPFVKVLGLSTLSIRLPAVIFGILGLVTLHRLVRVTCGSRIALAAVALAAAHPEMLWYSQEARVYSFGMMVAPIAIEGAWTASRTGRRSALVRYVVAGALLGWAHNLFAPVVMVLGLWLLWQSRHGGLVGGRRWIGAHAAIAALCALPAWWALSTMLTSRIPATTMAPATLESLAGGWRLPDIMVLLLAAALFSFLVDRLLPARMRNTDLARPVPPVSAVGLFVLLLLAVPLIQTVVGLALHRPFYMVRYRMPVVILVAPLLAWLVLAVLPLRRPAGAMAALAVLLHLAFPLRMLATMDQASYHHVDTHWDQVLARVDAEWRPGTVVLFQNPLQEWVYVDVHVDPSLEGLLLSPLRSHYVTATIDRSFALPSGSDEGRLERVVAARLRATEPKRVILVGWTPDAKPGDGPTLPLPARSDWTFRTERVWDASVTIATRHEAISAADPGPLEESGAVVR